MPVSDFATLFVYTIFLIQINRPQLPVKQSQNVILTTKLIPRQIPETNHCTGRTDCHLADIDRLVYFCYYCLCYAVVMWMWLLLCLATGTEPGQV